MRLIFNHFFIAVVGLFSLACAYAGSPEPLYHPSRMGKMPVAPKDKPFAEHFVVFHLSAGEAYAQQLVLSNAQSLLDHYGPDLVAIEIVSYGPGLRLLFRENELVRRISRMSTEGVTFSACANTMKVMGRELTSLHKSAQVVPGGVLRLLELQEAGWSYIRP